MEVRSGKGREIVFTPTNTQASDLDSMLAQARAWFRKAGQDPVKALHVRRQMERELEVRKLGRRSS